MKKLALALLLMSLEATAQIGRVTLPCKLGSSDCGPLPAQTGNSGKYLTTDGTAASWGTVSGGGLSGLTTGVIQRAASASTLGDSYLIQTTNTITQRNGANAQTFTLCASYTDGSNYECASLVMATGSVTISPVTAGTGSANIDIVLAPAGTGSVIATAPLRVGRTGVGDRGLILKTDSGGYPQAVLDAAAPLLTFYGSSYGDAFFQVSDAGGFQFASRTRPACNAGNRGAIAYVAGGAGVADTLEVCRKDNADAYAWVTLY